VSYKNDIADGLAMLLHEKNMTSKMSVHLLMTYYQTTGAYFFLTQLFSVVSRSHKILRRPTLVQFGIQVGGGDGMKGIN